MAGQPPPPTPRILLARGGRWPRVLHGIATPPGTTAPIDLDLTGFGGAFAARRCAGCASLWLPAGAADGEAATTAARIRSLVGGAVPTLVTVEAAPGDAWDAAAFARLGLLATALAGGNGPGRVAFGLRATHLAGGRRHLAGLTALRRLAEEWDIGVALDLSGSFDPQWEAEAAVVRLGRRVLLLRVSSDALAPSPVDRARVARRAVLAALERCPGVAVAIEPRVPWWRPGAAAERGRVWVDAEQRLRRRLVPPTLHGPDVRDRLNDLPSRRRLPPV